MIVRVLQGLEIPTGLVAEVWSPKRGAAASTAFAGPFPCPSFEKVGKALILPSFLVSRCEKKIG